MTVFEDFKRYLETEKNFSPNTVTNYMGCVNNLFQALDHKDPFLVTFKDVRNWIVLMSEQNMKNTSIKKNVSAVNQFFKHLQKRHGLEVNPAHGVPTPKVRKKLPNITMESDINRIIDSDYFGNDWQGIRNRFIIYILYTTGMRISELINLKVQDFDLKLKQVKITGKGNKQRLMPLLDEMIDEYNKYIEARNSRKDVFHQWLIISDRGRQVYKSLINNVVNDCMKSLNCEARGAHSLRHSLATHMVDREVEIKAVADLLGHATIRSTQVYTQLSAETKIRSYNKFFNR